ncbi:hypothetical protein PVAND_006137 [Polypedilum vanderplanki]|uniref:Ataxin-2 C-terminal domain-containing protein n=1 Tax=Polypedilum vanderplanki TaxID=319348 RepID=A0A9J6C275_POLVA|nr:hypothetical protein PVAND_006137 [Polypedilum vanderplanki]
MLMLLLLLDLGIIGAATQGIEESEEGSDDEWNYIKAENKKVDTEIEDTIPQQQSPEVETSSTVVEQHEVLEEEEQETAPIEVTDIERTVTVDDNIVNKDFEENLTESDNKFMEEYHHQTQQEEKENILIESEQQSSNIVEEQEKEPSVEERHISDEIEKDLQLQAETDEVEADDMDSQLNPDAKEFVPLSPTRNEFQSPPPPQIVAENGKSPFVNPILSNFHDSVVAQSPRKGESLIMADDVPEENDFEKEASERPHEVDFMDENFQRIESPNENELNPKEAMQVDDKLEQEYKDDSQGFFEEEKQQGGEVYTELEKSFSQYSNGFQNNIDDPMNRSFYEGRDSDILADPAKNVLNTTQPLFDEDELVATSEIQSTENKEIDLMSSGEPNASQMESSDHFEAEKFVEEIKGVEENKYVDSGLSPTVPDFASHQVHTEETIIVTHSPIKETFDNMPETFITQTSAVSDIEIPQQIEQEPTIEFKHTDIKENIPEEQNIEPVQEPEIIQESAIIQQEAPVETQQEKIADTVIEDAKIDEPNSEIIAAAAIASGVAIAAAKKKSTTTVKPDVKKVTDTKSKVAPKTTTDIKKAEVKPKTTATKPPPLSKPTVSKTSTTQIKTSVPSSASSAASRPKTTASAPLAKKAPLSSAPKPGATAPKTNETKPTPPSRTITAAQKRPISVSSAPASKSAATKPAIEVKAKVERKPIASLAPATRAPLKPTTLATKPKLNGTTSTLKSPSTTTRPATNARLNVSATEKSLSSPLKEKVLNKSASAATPGRSPRPASALVTAKTTAKTDLKSPSAATKPANLSAVGTKKPLTITKKPSPTDKTLTKTTTITTVTKKPVSATTKTAGSSTVKKTTTTTTTVVKKKVLNGDVVSEETSTTTKTTGDDELIALNGHLNGNGIAENGNGIHEEEQQQQQPVIEPSLI